MHEELDLKILKGIIEDKVNALTYTYRYGNELFDEDSAFFAGLVLSYIKHYRAPPTRRTLRERHAGSDETLRVIDSSWDEIEALNYNIIEFSFDLEEMKNRFRHRAVEKVREQAASDDPDRPENPEEYFNKLSMEISKATSLDLERTHTQKPVGDYIDEFKDSYEIQLNNPGDTTEIKTGWSLIDSVYGGLAPGELIMFGGETGSGKSMCLNNIAKQIWMQENTLESINLTKGYNILYFSLEMSYRECFIRFLASLANVPQRSITKACLLHDEQKRVDKAYEFIKKHQENGYFFDIVDVPRNLTIEEVELRYHDAMMRYKPEVVIVDYMGLMHSKALAKEQDWLKLGGISSSLHEFSRAYDCTMITAAQLTDLKRSNNSLKDDNKNVGVHRWGRSSLIMHNVNLGIQIETRLNENSFPDLKIHIVKNRKGPLAQGSFVKNFANASLIDVPYDERQIQGDVSANIPELIKYIQDQKNRDEEASK